ncbi:MAG: peptidoglycan bridge formation glycyltransferase FemA/FemB family protein, partial [Candidatus Margulisbacteria bacterium]|nr:peptidoglycan bridge formation glycyltransferase FemA/FemB family protein [Candidatus Margulisiibacteriota bacterium]
FLLAAVEGEAENHRAISLKIDPEIPDVAEAQSEVMADLRRLGFIKASRQVQPRATYFLDLTPDLNDILMGFEEKTRYNIRLAQKKGVVIREDPSEKGLNNFYDLYKETSGRDKFMIHPLRYYQSIRELLFKRGLGSNFIAYYDKKPIAAVIVFCFGSRVWYMYGASASEHRKVMPNHLLHWQIIQWAKAKGLKLYDLWGIPVNPKEGHPLWGVYRFKKGFLGKNVKFIGAYDFPYSPLFYNVFEYGSAWWKNINSLIKKGKIEDSLSE